MIPWSVLDTAMMPGGGQLRLKQRGSEFSIMLGSNIELMNSRLSGSEEALASMACTRIRDCATPDPDRWTWNGLYAPCCARPTWP